MGKVDWKIASFDKDECEAKIQERCKKFMEHYEALFNRYWKNETSDDDSEYANAFQGYDYYTPYRDIGPNDDNFVRNEWIDEARNSLGTIGKMSVTGQGSNSITYSMSYGYPKGLPKYKKIRTYVVEYGNDPDEQGLQTKPGEQTWHPSNKDGSDKLRVLRKSRALSSHALPKSWSRPGNHAYINTMRLMKKHWKRDLEVLRNNILKDIISSMIFVKG